MKHVDNLDFEKKMILGNGKKVQLIVMQNVKQLKAVCVFIHFRQLFKSLWVRVRKLCFN